MNEKKDCKIVQDLLPNYIENLTNEQTNKYIEDHLKKCEECKKIYDNMKQELQIHTEKSDKRKVNGFKKYNSKLKGLRISLILIILLILFIFIGITGRKMIIISNLYNKAQKYKNSDNYHITMYQLRQGESGESEFYETEIFKMGDKVKIVSIDVKNGEVTKQISIGNKVSDIEYNTHEYIQTSNEKIYISDGTWGRIELIDYEALHTKNFWDLIQVSIKATVKEKTIRGKECYYIDNFASNDGQNTLEGVYFDKENGLAVYCNKYKSEEYAQEMTYEFDTVTEQDFIEPDKTDYTEMTKNEYMESIFLNE